MKKVPFKSVCFVLLFVIISLLAVIPINSVEANKSHAWMQQVSDEKRIVEMSIPGTHDSGATHSIFDVAGKCQDMGIKEQLNIGVRFFDIRLQLVNDKFEVVHSFVKQNLMFSSVIDDMGNYIRNNPSEFLLVSIKKEESDINSTLGFEEALKNEIKNYEDVISYDTSLPDKLKDARGKIYFLSRYDLSFGIKAYSNWQDDTTFETDKLYVQDNYCIENFEIKKQDILDTIEYSKTNKNKLVLNFTSCYLDNAFPPTYAGAIGKDINLWLKEYYKQELGCLGIMVMDFISYDLSKSIYERNY